MPKSKNITELSARNRYTITLDDDPMVHKIIEKITGMPSYGFQDTATFFQRIKQMRPLAFFVDVHIGMESTNGIEIVPRIKAHFSTVPVIIITSDMDAAVLGRALEVGADDFVKKPIQAVELSARFRARLFSLRERAKNGVIRYSDLSFEPISGRLSGNGKRCLLSPLESKILSALMKGQSHVLSKELLKQQAWGRDNTSDNALNRKIFEVRKAVKGISRNLDIQSSYGKGFSLVLAQNVATIKKAA